MKPFRNTRLYKFWDGLRSSYWFVPTLLVIAAVLLALVLIAADHRSDFSTDSRLSWIFLGKAESARSILSTIATSMVTVVSLTFSMTVVVLTLASSQFGPRLLYNFMRDRSNQFALGIFVACFVFCILVLRTVQSEGAGGHVPHLSTNAAIIFAVLSIGVLIYFIHHIADSIQADTVIAHVRDELEIVLKRNIPHRNERADEDAEERQRLVELAEQHAAPYSISKRGILEAVDQHTLVGWARKHDVLVLLRYRPGDFLIQGNVLLDVYPRERFPRDDLQPLEQVFSFGHHRTLVQDIEFAFQQLVEIAVRALSPGINDPFTAIACINELGSGLALMAKRGSQPGLLRDQDGQARVVLKPVDFEGVADMAFHQIRQNGAAHPAVMIRMLEIIAEVAQSSLHPKERAILQRHARAIRDTALGAARDTGDRADIGARYQHAHALLGGHDSES